MFGRVRRGWGLTKKAWAVIRSHPGLAKLPLTGGALALVAFVLLGIPGALLVGSDNTGAVIGGIVVLAIATYLASFTVIYLNIALAAAADQAMRGEEPDLSAARGVARSRVGKIVYPLIHGDRGWFAGRKSLPVLRGTLVHVTVERLPDGRDPHRAMWLWHAGPGPLSLDELWRAYLARFDIEHAIRTLKGILGLTAAKVRAPEQADRWVRLLMAAHAQLLLARPLAADLRRPWEKQPDPARPLAPGRVRRGFRNIRSSLGTTAHVAKPSRPGPGRPKGSSKGPAPRHLLPGEAGMPRTAKAMLTREKVNT